MKLEAVGLVTSSCSSATPFQRIRGEKRRGADPQLSRLPCPAGILLKQAHFSPLPCLVL